MAKIGRGYGSEWHLLRYLGRHRGELNRTVCAATGADRVEWLDFPFDPRAKPSGDAEWKGLEWLPADSPARRRWSETWPQRGNPPNWDAVGRLHVGSRVEWLLVEAKANVEEIRSSCQAAPGDGRKKISDVFSETKQILGASPERDWLTGYYQFANRVTSLRLLTESDVPAHLLFIYFVGDRNGSFTCPTDAAGWDAPLRAQKEHIGLPAQHALAGRMHSIFLPVAPPPTASPACDWS